jgi:soluble lytic murein transglycosylase-like protein
MGLIDTRPQLLNLVKNTTAKQRVDEKLLDAIIITESGYDQWAVRYEPNFSYTAVPDLYAKKNRISVATEKQCQKMSWGLAQIMGGTARFLGYNGPLTQLLEPETNIHYACRYIIKLMVEYPHMDDQIAAYNAGSVRYKSDGKTRVYVNQEYVDKVMRAMQTAKI